MNDNPDRRPVPLRRAEGAGNRAAPPPEPPPKLARIIRETALFGLTQLFAEWPELRPRWWGGDQGRKSP